MNLSRLFITFFCVCPLVVKAAPDLILHNGKVVTVDKNFSIHQAISVTGNKITALGSNADLLKEKGAHTEMVDLGGRMVLPGLIDSHTHPLGASLTEFNHVIPE